VYSFGAILGSSIVALLGGIESVGVTGGRSLSAEELSGRLALEDSSPPVKDDVYNYINYMV
jgi:hypothetical protein